MDSLIIAKNLTKRFNGFTAVDHINFEVKGGEIFGFLGPNGAGKSTTIRMLCTLTKPTEGTAIVGGYDIVKQAEQVRRVIGLVAEKLILYPQLTAVENLKFFGKLYGLRGEQLEERIKELLDMVLLTKFKDFPVGGYSSGMRQRLNIIRGLIHNPKILFLDEPTTMLDPQSVQFIRELIKELKETGKTIVLTTHIMEEAEKLSDKVGIIDHGKIIDLDTSENLKRKYNCSSLHEVFLELTGRTLRDSTSNNMRIGVMGRI
ncbi:ATP-binding cassette domain-containing protein [Candidatus Bathyarchaeota archaeon]|nr:ATP-binding cassette domain-containing protein [Candidatus Bathyarchaeota archaeon]